MVDLQEINVGGTNRTIGLHAECTLGANDITLDLSEGKQVGKPVECRNCAVAVSALTLHDSRGHALGLLGIGRHGKGAFVMIAGQG